jgi:phage terminase large subunit-like protein
MQTISNEISPVLQKLIEADPDAADKLFAAELEKRAERYKYDWLGSFCPNRPDCPDHFFTREDVEQGLAPSGFRCIHGRHDQLVPILDQDEDTLIYDIETGRGYGKTRSGAESIRKWALEIPNSLWFGIEPTIEATVKIMCEGESGFRAVFKPEELKGGKWESAYNRSNQELFLANGAKILLFTSEKPDAIRGYNFDGGWGDEYASWKDADKGITDPNDNTTFMNMLFATRTRREGRRIRIIMTSTPKRVLLVRGRKGDANHPAIPALKELMNPLTGKPLVRFITGSLLDNKDNLAPSFTSNMLGIFGGTNVGRQEIYGETLEDIAGALWKYDDIIHSEKCPRDQHDPRVYDLSKLYVAVDPSVSDGKSDKQAECGIILGGMGKDGRLWVLKDFSLRGSPQEWGKAVVDVYNDYNCDAIIAEKNNGGELVRVNIQVQDPNANVVLVWASHGKEPRAEPISSLYEKHMVFHDEEMVILEEQLVSWVQGKPSPDRLDALVWLLTHIGLRAPLQPITYITSPLNEKWQREVYNQALAEEAELPEEEQERKETMKERIIRVLGKDRFLE